MKASVALESWLASTEQRQVDVVRALDVSKQLVSFWVTGRGVPGLELAEALERLTDGAVKVMDWREPAAMADQRGASSARIAAHVKLQRLKARGQRARRTPPRTKPTGTR